MADEENLATLKQGIKPWNEWRENNPLIIPDLRGADLSGAHLSGADLSGATLSEATLSRAILTGADLSGAQLSGADLSRAILTGADLSRADLYGAHLSGAHLSWAILTWAILTRAHLSGADLSGANLFGANLSWANLFGATLSCANLSRGILTGVDLTRADLTGANLFGANFDSAEIGNTVFADVDLSVAIGLETVKHRGPSTIGIDTLYKSSGNIPEALLRGCGVPDSMIIFARSLVGKPSEFYSAFIGYSSKDDDFAQRLHADLQSKGVRVWFAPEDLKIGDKLRDTIDQAIRIYDKLIVVISQNSINSAWVRREIKAAFEKEKDQNRTVLFPLRLDDAVIDSTEQWADDIRRDRHIGDFTMWKSHGEYQKAFDRLLRDLQAESGKAGG